MNTTEPRPQPALHPPTVLSVEDDPLLRAVYKHLFTSLGFRCIMCNRPDEALHVLFLRSVALVTLDYDLPGMPGPELAQVIRSMRPGLPILLITGRVHISTEDRALFESVHRKGEEADTLLSEMRCLYAKASEGKREKHLFSTAISGAVTRATASPAS